MPLCPQITNTAKTVAINTAITAVTYTSTTATYTSSGHALAVGDSVTITGLAPAGYNGTFTISSVAASTFTVANTTNAVVTDGVGSAASNSYTVSSVTPIVAATTTDTSSLSTQITTAQASADGKNKINYSTSGPSGLGTNVGDIWWQYSAGIVIAQYSWDGSSWVSSPISSAVIANIDAAKITSGIISSIEYNNGSGTFRVTAAGALTATSANITGTITSTSGTIGGFTVASNYLSGSGGFTLNSNGTIDGGSGNTIFYGKANIGGGTAGSETLIITGASNFNGAITGLAITANGELYAAGHTTTANAANGYVFVTGGRIARSTASSQRYKENIVDLLSVPELNPKKLLSLPVRAFSYKDGELPESDDRYKTLIPGFIAEEVDAIYPIAADYVDGPESWNDRMIVPALLSLVQDLYKRVEELEAK